MNPRATNRKVDSAGAENGEAKNWPVSSPKQTEAGCTEGFLPIFLDVRDRLCLVVGGGPMALQKIRDLLDCKARVHLVAPAAARCIEDVESHPGFRWSKRLPCEKDVSESYLVFASDEPVEGEQPVHYRHLEELREMADRHGRLYNALDHRELCHFTNPSVARNAPLVVAISTGGSSPVLGQFLRDRIRSEILTDMYASFARFLGRYRMRIRSLIPDYEKRREFYQSLIDTGFIAFFRDTNEEEALSELIRRVAEYRKEKGYEEEAVR